MKQIRNNQIVDEKRMFGKYSNSVLLNDFWGYDPLYD